MVLEDTTEVQKYVWTMTQVSFRIVIDEAAIEKSTF